MDSKDKTLREFLRLANVYPQLLRDRFEFLAQIGASTIFSSWLTEIKGKAKMGNSSDFR
jgi:hypothetical protein